MKHERLQLLTFNFIASVRYQTVGQNAFSFEGFSLSNLWKFTLAEKSWLQHKNAKLSDQSRYCMVHSAHSACRCRAAS